MVTKKNIGPLNGLCRCLDHAKKHGHNKRRVGIKFYYIASDKLPIEMLCPLQHASKQTIRGGLVVPEESLKQGVVTFLSAAAFDLRNLKNSAIPIDNL